MLGAVVPTGGFLQFTQQFLLTLVQVDRRLDDQMAHQVAMCMAADPLDTLAAQAEHPPGLGFRRNSDGGGAIQCRDLDFSAQCRRGERDRHFAMQVVVITGEHRMLLEVNLDIEVAGRTTIDAVFAFTGETDAIALIDPGASWLNKPLS